MTELVLYAELDDRNKAQRIHHPECHCGHCFIPRELDSRFCAAAVVTHRSRAVAFYRQCAGLPRRGDTLCATHAAIRDGTVTLSITQRHASARDRRNRSRSERDTPPRFWWRERFG